MMEIVETPIFTSQVNQLLSAEEYRGLQLALAPAGARGVQMKQSEFDNLVESIRQAGKIRRGQIEASRRFEFGPIDIKGIRARLKLSQSEFALMIGVSVSTLQNWEQGRRTPEGPARALLKVVEQKPEAVLEALAS